MKKTHKKHYRTQSQSGLELGDSKLIHWTFSRDGATYAQTRISEKAKESLHVEFTGGDHASFWESLFEALKKNLAREQLEYAKKAGDDFVKTQMNPNSAEHKRSVEQGEKLKNLLDKFLGRNSSKKYYKIKHYSKAKIGKYEIAIQKTLNELKQERDEK